MHLTIIGAGRVGGALGARWAAAGHHITFGVRDPRAPRIASLLATVAANARAAGVAESARGANVIALCTPWPATEQALKSLGDLRGRVIIDCTNPIAPGPAGSPGLGGLSHGLTMSGGEAVAAWAPGAHVVKTLNTTGWENMLDPLYGGERATMFLCGDDEDARLLVAGLLRDLGFEPCDAGPLPMSRYLEPLAMLWIHLAHAQGLGTGIAFRLMKR